MSDKATQTADAASTTQSGPQTTPLSDGALTPIQMLAIALAYMIDADKVHEAEERAELVVVFNKMVTRGEFNKQGLAEVIAKAFTYIKETEIDAFLAIAAEKLAPLQKVSVFINALDLMLSDGQVNGGETAILKKIQDAFGIDRDMVMAIREVIFAKNDTRMFLHPEHPRNASDAFLRINYRAAATNE
jgi:uncharacterized tellurite resistance protein B-like protein